jgi:hypothetical protein
VNSSSAKDRFAGEALQASAPVLATEYLAAQPSRFLFFKESTGLDGIKLGAVQNRLAEARAEVLEETGTRDPQLAIDKLSPEDRQVLEASIEGDRKTLVADSIIPAIMALIYLALLVYFRSIGGYKPVHIVPVEEQERKAHQEDPGR